LAILNDLRQEWRRYLSGRLWALVILLALLTVLAVIQYQWIGQVAEAERQRAKATLATALSRVENDFDIEITRAFAVFEVPATSLADYSERYEAWLRSAPYPSLVRGVYVVKGDTNGPWKATVIGGPKVDPDEWQESLARLTLPAVAISRMGPVTSSGGFQVLSQAGVFSSSRLIKPEVVVDGNPAFVFPVPPVFPPLAAPAGTHGISLVSRRPTLRVQTDLTPFHRWGVVVLNAEYVRSVLLPKILKVHFPKAASEYDILVVDETPAERPRVVFRSDSAPPAEEFAHADASAKFFQLRMDCFLPSPSREIKVITSRSGMGASISTSAGEPSELLTRTPSACNTPLPALDASEGLWRVLVRSRAGSLEQAMATFRQKNLLLGGGVLFVLAIGILVLIALAERARALAQMQTEFVLGVSHELRTPLTVIRLAADNLRKGMVENSDDARKYGKIVDAHAMELSNMIEETLLFARIQSTARVLCTAPVSPEQIVRTSLENCARLLDQAGLQLELDLARDLPLVDVDARLISRCLDNLIQNATKYAAAGRWIGVRARKESDAKGACVRITVADRGPGISPLDSSRIFEAFYRGTQAEASQVPGVGLGLTLVKRAVESHRGRVEVDRPEGRGARFSLVLPAHADRANLRREHP
jgi:signal transduction histidine kinase